MNRIEKSKTLIPLPLHCYDEAGHIKPPFWLYLTSLWLCKGFLILVLSASMRDNATALVTFFYPNNQDWFISVAPAIFGLAGVVILSLRDVLREREALGYQKQLRLTLTAGLCVSLATQFANVYSMGGGFEMSSAVLILMSFSFLGYVWRSKHARLFCNDAVA